MTKQDLKQPVTHKGTSSGIKTLWPWFISIALVWVFHFFFADFIPRYYFMILVYAGINIVLAVSLNLLNGFTGQFSMGHAGFMSVGGYTSAFLTISLQQSYPELFASPVGATLIFIAAMIAGGAVASLAGYVVGLPSLRLRGDYLAIVTLGFGEIIRVIILNIDAIGGPRGLSGIPDLSTFGWVYTLAVITIFTVWRLINSAHGRAFLSVREDEIAAESMGVNTTRAKVRAFVIGAFFAGVAGALYAHFVPWYLKPDLFDYNKSFEIIIMVVLGGMGSISGSVVAALFLTIIREALRPLKDYTGVDLRMIIYSLMLIGLMLTRPNGIFGTREITDFLPKSWRRRLLGRGADK